MTTKFPNTTKTARKQAKRAKSGGTSAVRPKTKLSKVVELLSRDQGVTIKELQDATGWQPHSVRGALSGSIKKKLGLTVSSEIVEGRGRVYRATAGT